jgi:hypothetical protein
MAGEACSSTLTLELRLLVPARTDAPRASELGVETMDWQDAQVRALMASRRLL